MDATTATAFITANKGAAIIIRLTDGMTAFGDAFSVNSKGVNIKVDGKTRSVALSKIDGMDLDNLGDDDDIDTGMDAETDAEIYAMLGDGMTTAELASHLSDALSTEMTPKELRVHLRALGLGVGKGRKYALTATEYRMVKDLVTTATA
jgi:DNA-binding transcriptional ArsR family regulator